MIEGKLDKRLLALFIGTVLMTALIIFTENVVVEGMAVLVIFNLGILTDEHMKKRQLMPIIHPVEEKEHTYI